MKLLLAVLIGIILGVGALMLTASDYQTSSDSDLRLFERVFGNRV